MNKNEFRSLYNELNNFDDIEILAKKTGLDSELLLVLYTQKTVRMATKRFYKIKHKAKLLLRKWNQGRTFLSLSNELKFPPVLTAYLILLESSISRKKFWEIVRNPENIKDRRMKKEIFEIIRNDIIYSPEGNEMQYARGKRGEKRLCDWLDKQNLEYQTEDELKGTHQKTPDVLLSKPIKTNGMNVHWIESKASFGDEIEIRKNTKRQLRAYTELFGPGIVVYWFGFIEGAHPLKNVLIVDESFFEKDLEVS